MFLVTIPAGPAAAYTVWLRGTVFTSDESRATLYTTRELAQEAITKAAKFHKKSTMKACAIVEKK